MPSITINPFLFIFFPLHFNNIFIILHGKMDEVLFFLKYNIGEVQDDVAKMVNGSSV